MRSSRTRRRGESPRAQGDTDRRGEARARADLRDGAGQPGPLRRQGRARDLDGSRPAAERTPARAVEVKDVAPARLGPHVAGRDEALGERQDRREGVGKSKREEETSGLPSTPSSSCSPWPRPPAACPAAPLPRQRPLATSSSCTASPHAPVVSLAPHPPRGPCPGPCCAAQRPSFKAPTSGRTSASSAGGPLPLRRAPGPPRPRGATPRTSALRTSASGTLREPPEPAYVLRGGAAVVAPLGTLPSGE